MSEKFLIIFSYQWISVNTRSWPYQRDCKNKGDYFHRSSASMDYKYNIKRFSPSYTLVGRQKIGFEWIIFLIGATMAQGYYLSNVVHCYYSTKSSQTNTITTPTQLAEIAADDRNSDGFNKLVWLPHHSLSYMAYRT